MLLTTTQASEKLGISRAVITRLVHEGVITPANSKKEGKKKFFMKFDSKHINEFKKNTNGHKIVRNRKIAIKPTITTTLHTGTGIMSMVQDINKRTDKIEKMIEHLVKIWN